MTRMVSTTTMIAAVEGLLGTSDLQVREASFVETLVHMRDEGRVTALSERQVEWLNDLWRKHFA